MIPTEDNIPVSSYTTLSYCWGNRSFIKLTSSVYSKFRSWLPLSDLPQAFQDAITITRDLKIQFIWIDALCIVQDSNEDFHRQSSEMSLIYANTSCNIAAGTGDNPHAPLFGQRDPKAFQIGRFECDWEADDSNHPLSSLNSVFDGRYFDDLQDAHLFSRGWILQELLLSPRFVFCARNQIHWFCRYFEACDVWPEGNPPRFYRRVEPGNLIFRGMTGWAEIVMRYSKLALSHPQDRLVALSGLAKVFQSDIADAYVAGHWKSQLQVSLHWSPHDPFRKLTRTIGTGEPYVAPSWSWASFGAEVWPEWADETPSFLCEIRSVSVKPVGLDPTGQILGGRLVLMAPSKSVLVSSQQEIHLPELRSSKHTTCYASWSSEVQFQPGAHVELALTYVNIHKIHWSNEESWKWELQMGSLILMQPNAMSEDYERIGSYRTYTDFRPGQAPERDGLEAFGLEINDNTSEVTAGDNCCYQEFSIV